MSVSYHSQQIAQWLDPHTMVKARPYANAVSDVLWIEDDTLAGRVHGSSKRPYDVRVYFHDIEDDMWVEGECTCPVSYGCKHVAALLIAGLAHQPKPPATGVRGELVTWLEGFRARRTEADVAARKKAIKPTYALVYVIDRSYRGGCEVSLRKARIAVDGSIRAMDERWYNVERALVEPPKFVRDEDLPILRGLWLGRSQGSYGNFGLQGATGADILEKIVATGRAFAVFAPAGAHNPSTPPYPVRRSAERGAQLTWEAQPDSRVRPILQTEPAASSLLLTLQPCWYIDANAGEAGPLALPWPAEQLADYLSMPAITLDEAELVGNVLREVAPELPAPPAHDRSSVQVIDTAPVPVLALDTKPTWASLHDFATVGFDYAGHRLPAASNTTLIRTDHGEVIQIKRNAELERKRLMGLQKAGLRQVRADRVFGPQPFPEGMLAPEHEQDWPELMRLGVPALRENGWHIEMSADFRHNVIEIDAIDGSLRQSGDGWFDVEMGITVNGRTVRLEPLLADLFRREARWLSGQIDAIADDEAIDLKTDRNERIRLRADRLKPVVRVLVDLFDSLGGEGMRISEWDAARLDALDQTGRWQFHGDTAIRQLAQRLMAGPGVTDVPVPRSLQAELRAYQRQGLAWMQFLREHDLSGVLADDMGLGKTVQTLAHILAEKEGGRLDRPALIVLPTTLMHNWSEEARRFAPSLRVLDLHGRERHDRFEEIGEHDLILTTYALLAVARPGSAGQARLSPADPRRGAVRQECRHQVGGDHPRTAGAAPPVPHGHAARKSSGRTVGPVRLPVAGLPRIPA